MDSIYLWLQPPSPPPVCETRHLRFNMSIRLHTMEVPTHASQTYIYAHDTAYATPSNIQNSLISMQLIYSPRDRKFEYVVNTIKRMSTDIQTTMKCRKVKVELLHYRNILLYNTEYLPVGFWGWVCTRDAMRCASSLITRLISCLAS